MAKKKAAPVADVPMNPDPVVVETTPTDTPTTTEATVEGAPATDAAPTATAETPPADEPPAQVIVVFDRPPVDVEMEIRVAVQEGKDLVGMRLYRTWANAREGVDAEGGPAKLGLLEAQDAVRWLVAQPKPEGAVVEPDPEPTTASEGGEVVYLAQPAARPTPAPAAPPREKVLATRSIQHEYTLTDDERITLGSALANLEADVENEEADQAAKKRAMRERLSGLKGERARVADIIRRGAEVRTISVIDVADYEDRVVRTMREDTCEVVATRPLDPHEAQLPLFTLAKAADTVRREAGEPDDPFSPLANEDDPDTDTDTDTDDEEVEEEDE